MFSKHACLVSLHVHVSEFHSASCAVFAVWLPDAGFMLMQVVDFQWNPHDPWTFMSVSDDVSDELGGGTLQLWRVNDLIYREEAEVLAELDKHRQVGPQCFPPSSSAAVCI